MNKQIEKRLLKLFDEIESVVKSGGKLVLKTAPVLYKEAWNEILLNNIMMTGIGILLFLLSVFTHNEMTDEVGRWLVPGAMLFVGSFPFFIGLNEVLTLLVAPTLTVLRHLRSTL